MFLLSCSLLYRLPLFLPVSLLNDTVLPRRYTLQGWVAVVALAGSQQCREDHQCCMAGRQHCGSPDKRGQDLQPAQTERGACCRVHAKAHGMSSQTCKPKPEHSSRFMTFTCMPLSTTLGCLCNACALQTAAYLSVFQNQNLSMKDRRFIDLT